MRKMISGFVGILVGLTVLLGVPVSASASPAIAPPGGWRFSNASSFSTLTSGVGYRYAGAQEGIPSPDYIKTYSANVYVAHPYLEGSATGGSRHTLAELAGESADSQQIVEVGWAEEPQVWGDDHPRLFSCIWVNGDTTSGCWDGVQSGTVTGWIDNSANPIDLGADLLTTAELCDGVSLGCVKQMKIKFVSGISSCGVAANGWEIDYDGVKVGCWMGTQWSHATPPVTFDQLKFVQSFGEVYYGGSTEPKTDMGNGQYGSTAPLSASGPAYFGTQTFSGGTGYTTYAFNLIQTDANAYTAGNVGSVGNRTYGYGGAGYKFVGGVPVSPGDIGS